MKARVKYCEDASIVSADADNALADVICWARDLTPWGAPDCTVYTMHKTILCTKPNYASHISANNDFEMPYHCLDPCVTVQDIHAVFEIKISVVRYRSACSHGSMQRNIHSLGQPSV